MQTGAAVGSGLGALSTPARASLRAAVGGKIHIVILRLAGLEIADVV